MNGLAIWWVKRDARLNDNAAVRAALETGLPVLPVFCVEPSVWSDKDMSLMHQHAQVQAVGYLRQRLMHANAALFVGHGEAVELFEQLRRRWPLLAIYAHEEIGNATTFRRDRAVQAWCVAHNIAYHEFPQSSVRRGGVNRDHFQKLWQRRIVETEPSRPPRELRQPPELRVWAAASALPEFVLPREASRWQPVTEAEGQATLRDFLASRSRWYRGGISSPNTAMNAGSRLSVHLAWGTLSARQVWHATQARLHELAQSPEPFAPRWRQSLLAFISRLHWRDHFTQRLESEPESEFQAIHPCYRNVPYENSAALLAAWAEGRTGFPMVDAVMRCLAATGFVNFRMRAMAVSLACHALHLDWRLIHPHLARVFRDYDPGIHIAQLQMQAGVVGWNPIRVYSPMKQLADWDAQCSFVKKWLPELRPFSAVRILNHHSEPVPGYPPPVVDFELRTTRMKDWLYSIRKSAEAQAATPAVYARHGSRKKPEPRRMTPRPKKPHGHPQQGRLFD